MASCVKLNVKEKRLNAAIKRMKSVSVCSLIQVRWVIRADTKPFIKAAESEFRGSRTHVNSIYVSSAVSVSKWVASTIMLVFVENTDRKKVRVLPLRQLQGVSTSHWWRARLLVLGLCGVLKCNFYQKSWVNLKSVWSRDPYQSSYLGVNSVCQNPEGRKHNPRNERSEPAGEKQTDGFYPAGFSFTYFFFLFGRACFKTCDANSGFWVFFCLVAFKHIRPLV